MAYNYSPLSLAPFSYQRGSAPTMNYQGNYYYDGREHHDLNQWNQGQNQAQQQAFQGYSQDQFGDLFEAMNKLGADLGSYTSGQAQEQQVALAQNNALARQAFQASMPQAPQMNFQPTPQAYTGGGWGQQSPLVSSAPMTYRGQSPSGMLGTTNRGSHGGILGGSE
jgi:hypothetical protein